MKDDRGRDDDGSGTELWSDTEATADNRSTQAGESRLDKPEGTGAKLGADRALLVGLLALQNGFIDAQTLVDAIHTWIVDKSRTIGTILLGWDRLDGEQLAVLEQLASVAIKRDGGDVGRCLSGFSSTPSLLQLLGPHDDEVRTLLASATDLGRVQARARDGNRSGSRYQILGRHAQGGLGEVFLAKDIEVGRTVALKEIQGRYSDHTQYRARFLLEAEITAGLEHPGIVPIYGMGRYPDGRPYYAMRFIKGDSLKKTIADFRADTNLATSPRERALELRGLLRRFLDVCDAIEYAHSRRVLHRDIKPANIMLGKFGETLVVDWGVAKLLDKPDGIEEIEGVEGPLHPSATSEVEPTRMQSVFGTPAFMSPEQANGRIDILGIPSDVYSLGATLYCLLTGVTPFPEQQLEQIKPSIVVGTFPRPREVDATVHPALEAICLKAMAVAPSDRYPSSRALAEDLERWLDDEPVQAHAEPLAAKAARWARNHRPLVTGAVATLVVAVVALGVTLYLVSIERDKVIAADDSKAKTLALMEDTLGATCQTLTTLMGDIAADRFGTTPEFQNLRGFLADRAVRISTTILNQRPNDAYIQSITSPIIHQAGVIYRVLGRRDDASRQLREAAVVYEQREMTDPKHRRDHLQARASIAIDRGDLNRQIGEPSKAFGYYEEARRLAEQMQRDYPGDTAYQKPLARSYYNTAALLISRGQYAEAERPADLAISLLGRQVELAVDGKSTRLLLVHPLLSRAALLRETGRLDEAGRAIDLASKKIQDLVSMGMKSNATDYFRASLLYQRARLLAMTETDRPEADRIFGESLSILDILVEDFPNFAPYLAASAEYLIERARVRIEMGDPHRIAARDDARAATSILDDLKSRQPSFDGFKTMKGKALALLARLEPDQEIAQGLLTDAINLHEDALKGDPGNLIDIKALDENREALARRKASRP